MSGLRASLFGGFYLFCCLFVLVLAVPNTEFDGVLDLELTSETTGQQLSQQLIDKDVVHNKWSFKLAAWLLGLPQQQPQAGLYQLKTGWNNYQLIQGFKDAPRPSVEVIVHPYQKRINTLSGICQKLDIKYSSLQEVLEDQDYLRSWGPFNKDNIYCLFTADTMRVYRDVQARDLADQLVRRYINFWTPHRLEQAASLGLTPHEVGILASIVYAETKILEEMPVIAGLYLNRLSLDMKLQADPTVVYAVGRPLRRVLKVHKRVRSSYNTYLHKGLPPGPVFTPTPQAIDAVLNASTHDFLYFCAKVDFSGSHHFSRTLDEHQRYANTYQKALNRRRIGFKGS